MTHQTIVVLDFGSQFTQLIARRLRELSVYSEILPFNTPLAEIRGARRSASMLSGGPRSVSEPGRRAAMPAVFAAGVPVLGICYGMQLMTDMLGGEVAPAPHREFGLATITIAPGAPLFGVDRPELRVWASHGDFVKTAPAGFAVTATSANAPVAAMADERARILRAAVPSRGRPHRSRPRDPAQLRVRHLRLHRRLDDGVVRRGGDGAIREQVGDGRVVCGLSGGVDSTVAALLDSPGDRRSPDLHLRRQRRDAAGRGRADPAAVRAAAAAAGVRGRLDAVPRSAGGRHRSGEEAQDHRRGVHRRVRGRGEEARNVRLTWRRARSIPTSSRACR